MYIYIYIYIHTYIIIVYLRMVCLWQNNLELSRFETDGERVP